MAFKVTMSCDQPGCQIFITSSLEHVEYERRSGGWKVEELGSRTLYTCPNHGSTAPTLEERNLAEAGTTLALCVQHLNDQGFYVCGLQDQADNSFLHVHSYDYEETEGPRAVISQFGHSVKIEIRDADGTVLHDEDSEVWE